MRRLTTLVLLGMLLGPALVSHPHAYVLNGPKWATSTVQYYVNPSNLYVPSADAITAIQNGAAVWGIQANPSVHLQYAGVTSGSSLTLNYKNEVFFRNESNGGAGALTYWWADGANHIVDADIIFYEASYLFFTGSSGCHDNGEYIDDLVVHEFGHVQGLGHSADGAATMYPYNTYCALDWLSLDPDDISGIQALYPPSSSTVPAAPSQLSVLANPSNPTGSLSQTWVDNASNADGYRVERSPDGVGFTQVAQLGSTAASYVDSGLAAGATYYYRVAAFNVNGISAYSNLGTGQTQPSTSATSAPLVPSSPSPANGATNVGLSVTLSWGCSGATSYDVYINGALYAANLGSPSVTVSSLAALTPYSWSVVARNNVGSTAGPTWSFTTKGYPGNSGKNKR